ncbi:MAG: glutamate racemase [Coriobacteriales bacterium]|nr:glutamate racemase [Coriobacteriales bacterium]MBQ6586545.1 glutamate racemase [Coriobacteriales bacterium]
MERTDLIGVFDSGIGGLTVANEIAKALPHESILYFGDTARCPYGPRSQDEVRGFVHQICSWLCQQRVKLIVIACNTATAAGLRMAQKDFDVPVIGVIAPGARAAVQVTSNRKVGVIATVGTVESGAYVDAIHALDAGVTVYSKATPRFVQIAEEGLCIGQGPYRIPHQLLEEYQQVARDYLSCAAEHGIDTLVMGCTHFPLVEPLIAQAVGPDVKLISSAQETAREVAETLRRRGQLATGEPIYRFATTSDDLAGFLELGSRIFSHPVESIQHVDMGEE